MVPTVRRKILNANLRPGESPILSAYLETLALSFSLRWNPTFEFSTLLHKMRILITGGAGFVGQLLARHLLDDPNYTVVLTDVISPPIPDGVRYPHNAKTIKTDLCTAADEVVDKSLDAAFIFHGIMSSGSESNFELGMRVNVDATRALLDVLRQRCPGVRVIYSSSQAVYGLPLPEIVDDSVTPTPQSSYGAEKIICETIINDYTRRGFLNGLILRFPTISVRPGTPTAAASSFLSGMIREPLNGKHSIIPLEDRKFVSCLCSPMTLVSNLLHSLTLSPGCLPSHIRQINMPGISVTVQEMMDALAKVGGPDKLRFIIEKTDPSLRDILYSWPTRFDNSRAYKLGFKADKSFEQAVRDYKESLASF
jgi:nucleoside-diphosphate-sugar epimerase